MGAMKRSLLLLWINDILALGSGLDDSEVLVL
jgi:hypothetical protein